jgi:hypothetical protein
MGVCVGQRVSVIRGVRVTVGVNVGGRVRVTVGVNVGDRVRVTVGVNVGGTGVRVGDGPTVAVGGFVRVGEAVGLGVGA